MLAVQALPSSQLRGSLTHVCWAVHRSFTVHSSASAHCVFVLQHDGNGACWQPPALLQLSTVQKFRSSQSGGVPARHTPALHSSSPSQTLPFAQLVPSIRGVLTQPAVGLQLSSVHGFPSIQFRESLAQDPLTQRSLMVQASLSTQSASVKQQLGTAVWTQPTAASQPSVVHGFSSSQFGDVPGVQVPDWQVSKPLQKSRGPHDWPFGTGVKTQPLAGLQLSVVQVFPSLQASGSLVQVLFTQRSLIVQALASAQSASV